MFVCVSSVQLSCLLLFFIFMKVKESFQVSSSGRINGAKVSPLGQSFKPQ